jgi:hypothetical protein
MFSGAHEVGGFVAGGQLGGQLHDPCSFPVASPAFVIGGSLPVPSGTLSAGQ